jgi:hypothetical protein
MDSAKYKTINEIAQNYFEQNDTIDWIPAKKLMPELIKAGIFVKDEKNGLPLRKALRTLDKNGALDQIPLVHAERKGNTVYWYFVREGKTFVSKDKPLEETKKHIIKLKKENSDENYILNICDELLKLKSTRQHTFDFLRGDVHKNGITKTKLPVDAYYHKRNLVVEYHAKPLSKKQLDPEMEERITVSGVSRSEQRIIYTKRIRKVLKDKGIHHIVLEFGLFELDKQGKIVRNKEKDTQAIAEALRDHI